MPHIGDATITANQHMLGRHAKVQLAGQTAVVDGVAASESVSASLVMNEIKLGTAGAPAVPGRPE